MRGALLLTRGDRKEAGCPMGIETARRSKGVKKEREVTSSAEREKGNLHKPRKGTATVATLLKR